MKNLFIEPLVFEKKSNKYLSENMLMWPSEIITELYSQYPALANFPYTVNFAAKDEKTMSARGMVTIGPIEIPFIIENNDLKPMIVFYQTGQNITESLPLTESVILKFLAPKNFAKGLASTKKPSHMVTTVSNTYQVKSSSLLDLLDGTVNEEDKKVLLKTLQNTPSISATIKMAECEDVLAKALGLKTSDNKSEPENISEDIHYIYKTGSLGYTKVSGNSNVYSVKRSFLKEAEVTSETQLIKTCKKNLGLEFVKLANKSDVVKYSSNLYKVIELDTRLSPTANAAIDKNGNYLDNLEKTSEFEFSTEPVEFDTAKPSAGDYVYVKTANNKYVGPVFVTSSYSDKGQKRLHGSTNFTKVAFIEDNRISQTIFNDSANKIYVPTLETIKIGSKIDVKPSLQKKAYLAHTVRKDNRNFYLVGPEFNKYAELSGATNPYAKNDAIWTLIQLGASKETVDSMDKMTNGEIKVAEQLKAPVKNDLMLEKKAMTDKLVYSYINTKFKGLVKEAAAISNKSTLDVVLGLNLINEQNILELIENIPIIDGTLNLLSKLWLMSNVGLNSVPSESIKIVLTKLAEIRDILERLSYVIKVK